MDDILNNKNELIDINFDFIKGNRLKIKCRPNITIDEMISHFKESLSIKLTLEEFKEKVYFIHSAKNLNKYGSETLKNMSIYDNGIIVVLYQNDIIDINLIIKKNKLKTIGHKSIYPLKSVEKKANKFAPVNNDYIENHIMLNNIYGNFDGSGAGQNMSIPMGPQGGNMFMDMNNMMKNFQIMNKEWMKGFTLGVQEVAGSQEEDDGSQKVNVTFLATTGIETNIILPLNITIDQALQKYLKKVGKDELYAKKSNKICFYFNLAILKFGDQRKVGEVFGINKNPYILVADLS